MHTGATPSILGKNMTRALAKMLAAFVLALAVASAQTYTITDLGVLKVTTKAAASGSTISVTCWLLH
jgi:hypothetical protein